jgi:hypothetical protein
MWSHEFCGADLWLESWLQTLMIQEKDVGVDALPDDAVECMANDGDETAIEMSNGRKKKRDTEESRDDDDTMRPIVRETDSPEGKSAISSAETLPPSSELVPSDALERIEQAKAKAILLMAALQGLRTKKDRQIPRKKQRSSSLPKDFVSTRLTTIIETAESMLSKDSIPDKEKDMSVDIRGDELVFSVSSCGDTCDSQLGPRWEDNNIAIHNSLLDTATREEIMTHEGKSSDEEATIDVMMT